MMNSAHRQAVWDKTGGHCAYCGISLHQDDVKGLSCRYQSWMQIDHMTSPKDGGSELFDNLVPTCSACNSVKGRRSLESYRYAMAKKESGMPHIPREILDWLYAQGITLPDLPNYEFWFEKHGFACVRAEAAE